MKRCTHLMQSGPRKGARCVKGAGHRGKHSWRHYPQPSREVKNRSARKRAIETAHPCARHAVCGNWCSERATHCRKCAGELNGKRLTALCAERDWADQRKSRRRHSREDVA